MRLLVWAAVAVLAAGGPALAQSSPSTPTATVALPQGRLMLISKEADATIFMGLDDADQAAATHLATVVVISTPPQRLGDRPSLVEQLVFRISANCGQQDAALVAGSFYDVDGVPVLNLPAVTASPIDRNDAASWSMFQAVCNRVTPSPPVIVIGDDAALAQARRH